MTEPATNSQNSNEAQRKSLVALRTAKINHKTQIQYTKKNLVKTIMLNNVGSQIINTRIQAQRSNQFKSYYEN